MNFKWKIHMAEEWPQIVANRDWNYNIHIKGVKLKWHSENESFSQQSSKFTIMCNLKIKWILWMIYFILVQKACNKFISSSLAIHTDANDAWEEKVR